MMDFPDAPVAGDQYLGYTFDATNGVWRRQLAAGGGAEYVLKAGDTMSGNLTLSGLSQLCFTKVDAASGTYDTVHAKALDGKTLFFFKASQGGFYANQYEAGCELWTNNGGYYLQQVWRTIPGNPPSFHINGDCSAASITDRALAADPELSEFNGNLGQALKAALAKIRALERRLPAGGRR